MNDGMMGQHSGQLAYQVPEANPLTEAEKCITSVTLHHARLVQYREKLESEISAKRAELVRVDKAMAELERMAVVESNAG